MRYALALLTAQLRRFEMSDCDKTATKRDGYIPIA